jgi:hypothetical protein
MNATPASLDVIAFASFFQPKSEAARLVIFH